MSQNTNTPLSSFLDLKLSPSGVYQGQAVPDWSQGRTLYGGATAALCVESARRFLGDPPPLRSAQYCFCGPSSGTLSIAPQLLRRGRSATVCGVEVKTEEGIVAKATLAYGSTRRSVLHWSPVQAPQVVPPEECPEFFKGPGAPTFTCHFDFKKAGREDPISGAPRGEFLAWVRHRQPGTVDPASALMAIGDALPPAAMAMFSVPAPVSSLTWTVDVLSDPLPDPEEWLLLSAIAESAGDGYSCQKMTIWDRSGRLVVSGRQHVTIFC